MWFAMCVGIPINLMMIRIAKNSEIMSSATMQASFNVANALGAKLGFIPIYYSLTFNFASLVGAGMAFTGFVLAVLYFFLYHRNSSVA